MPKVKNRLFQPVTVLLSGDKSVYFGSRQELEISKADLESSHVQSLIKQEHLAVSDGGKDVEGRDSAKKGEQIRHR